MTEGIEAVRSRVAELQRLLGAPALGTVAIGRLGGAPSSSASSGMSSGVSSAAFADQLTGALTTAGSTQGAAGADLGAAAVSKAASYTGVPYLWGGEDPATGVDCSGLVQHVFGGLGVSLPRVAADQSRAGVRVPSLDQARPGDLVFFGSPAHHVGIYAGDGKMIDAPRSGKTVGLHDLWGTPSAIRRVVPTASDLTSTAAVSSRTGSRTPYADLFAAAGARHGVDPALLSAVAKAESAYNPRAVSPAGAQGLMQLMPGTARSLGVDAYDPAQAVDGAARLLSDLISDFGRVDLALAGYNAGPGAVRKYDGIPPYTETQNYVRRVTGYWKELA